MRILLDRSSIPQRVAMLLQTYRLDAFASDYSVNLDRIAGGVLNGENFRWGEATRAMVRTFPFLKGRAWWLPLSWDENGWYPVPVVVKVINTFSANDGVTTANDA